MNINATSDRDDTASVDAMDESPVSYRLASRPGSFIPVRRNRIKWTDEETQALLEGLRRHGRDYSAICNDRTLSLNSCRRTTDIRERLRVLLRKGLLPEDPCGLDCSPGGHKKRVRGAEVVCAQAKDNCSEPKTIGSVVEMRKGTFNEPVVRLLQEHGRKVSEWISTTHFPKPLVRRLLEEFVEKSESHLKLARELMAGIETRPEPSIEAHASLARIAKTSSPVKLGPEDSENNAGNVNKCSGNIASSEARNSKATATKNHVNIGRPDAAHVSALTAVETVACASPSTAPQKPSTLIDGMIQERRASILNLIH